jgi:signal transduction histidine kinase
MAEHVTVVAEHERGHLQLQEANEHLVFAALDAQQLQAAAELAQRRQTEFLAILAHELRNPLAPIRTAAALLGRVGNDEIVLARVQAIIERQVVHISRLVGDLMDVSRVNTGKLRLERRVIDLADIVDEAVDACRPAMTARSQNFLLDIPARRLELHGDPVRLAQVFSNLLDNASKYTLNGGEIRLSIGVADAVVVTTVSDNGIGITATSLPHVFDPFVQDIQATVFNGVGLGIGLTVVRELVEAHGGNIVASSAGSGLGSQFVVSLPLAERSPFTQSAFPGSPSPSA